MLYRIHQKLLVNSKEGVFLEGGAGCVHTLSMIGKATRAVLLKVGAISLVQAPPLSTFTGWNGRARKLDELGIDTIGFVTMDPRDVAYAIKATSRKPDTEQAVFDERVDKLAIAVERWQYEIKEVLGIGNAEVRR